MVLSFVLKNLYVSWVSGLTRPGQARLKAQRALTVVLNIVVWKALLYRLYYPKVLLGTDSHTTAIHKIKENIPNLLLSSSFKQAIGVPGARMDGKR